MIVSVTSLHSRKSALQKLEIHHGHTHTHTGYIKIDAYVVPLYVLKVKLLAPVLNNSAYTAFLNTNHLGRC